MLSCTSTKILNIEKYKVLPGAPTGAPFFRYKLDLKVKSAVKFISIKIDDLEEETSFSVIDLRTHMQSDNSILYNKGTYRLQFDLSSSRIDENNKDVLKLTYRLDDSIKILTKQTGSTKVIRLK